MANKKHLNPKVLIFITVPVLLLVIWLGGLLFSGNSLDDHHGHSHAHPHGDGHTHDGDHGHDHGTTTDGDREHQHESTHDHAPNQDHGHDHAVMLCPDAIQIERLDLLVQPVRAGGIDAWQTVPGEIKINHDTTAHMVPRVGGIVKEVRADLGERVKTGQILAVIESRDLATAKADYLALNQRRDLAQTRFEREKRLYTQQITSHEEYLNAEQRLGEIQIQLGAARQKLLILGVTHSDLKTLRTQPEDNFALYHMTAPFDGTIIRKHIVMGESVDGHSEVFEIADLSQVWADLLVNQKDVTSVKVGQEALITIDTSIPEVGGTIQYVDPVIDPNTRAAVARVILDNTRGLYRPGLFISGRILTKHVDRRVLVPKDSIQNVDDQSGVFVECANGFAFRPVTTGLSDQTHIEILSGISAGDRVVTKNAFHLKAEMAKQVGSGHGGHGHVH